MILVKHQDTFHLLKQILGYYESEPDGQIPNTYSQYANIAMETLLLKCQPEYGKSNRFKIISCLYICKNL